MGTTISSIPNKRPALKVSRGNKLATPQTPPGTAQAMGKYGIKTGAKKRSRG